MKYTINSKKMGKLSLLCLVLPPPRPARFKCDADLSASGGNNGNGSGSTGMLPGIEAAPIDAAAEAAASGEVLRTVSAGEARLPPVLR